MTATVYAQFSLRAYQSASSWLESLLCGFVVMALDVTILKGSQ